MESLNLDHLKSFFEENDLAKLAAASIKDGREIGLEIKTNSNETYSFTFSKKNGKNLLEQKPASQPDLLFRIPEKQALALVQTPFESVGQVGLHIFDKMLSSDEQNKITVSLNVGFLSLMAGGYLGVLTAGGSDIAKFLASKGLGNIGKIKQTISKLRG